MATFAQHRDTLESFVDCREAVAEAIQTVIKLAADLTYLEVLSGETHHAGSFRLQIEDTVVNRMDLALPDADGKIAEGTIWFGVTELRG
jgi:hypothetical protein